MSPRLFLPLLATLGACGEVVVAPSSPDGLTDMAAVPVDAPIDPDDGRIFGRWIVRYDHPVTHCPPAAQGSWLESSLFEQAGRAHNQLPYALQRYCLYEALPQSPAADEAGPEDQQTGGLIASPDTAAVAVAGSLDDMMQANSEALFLQQAGQHPDVLAGTVPDVRLAIIDSTPTYQPANLPWTHAGDSEHGYAMSNIARQLTCDADTTRDCFANISTQLALDLDWAGSTGSGIAVKDTVNGGEFGSIAGLAQAIRREVVEWGRDFYDGTGEALVLNLSLGWHPAYGGQRLPRSAWSADIQAVFDASVNARCQGALILAAAGNRSGGPSHAVGPILPAAWARDKDALLVNEVDGPKSCEEILYGPGGNWPGGTGPVIGDDVQLLWAVGGVDEQSHDIAVSRDFSRPPFVAYGEDGSVTDDFGVPTNGLTGTSVATVVASATAAAIWHEAKGKTPTEVMKALYDFGVGVGRPTDQVYCPRTGCVESKKVEVCGVVDGFCGANPCVDIGTATCASTAAPVSVTPSPLDALAFSAEGDSFTLGPAAAPRRRHVACARGTERLVNGDAGYLAADPCPEHQYYGVSAAPFTEPQPTTTWCPWCYVDRTNAIIFLEVKGGWAPFSSVTVTAERTGMSDISYTTTSLPSTEKVTYNIPAAWASAITSTRITFVSAVDSTSYTEEIRVTP